MKGINKRSGRNGTDLNTPDNITGSDKVIISSEYFEDTRPSYICSICNQTLIRLTDSSMQNTSFWCRNCSVEFDPARKPLKARKNYQVRNGE